MNCAFYNLLWLTLLSISMVSCSGEHSSKSLADLNEWRHEASLFPEYLRSEAETQFSKKL